MLLTGHARPRNIPAKRQEHTRNIGTSVKQSDFRLFKYLSELSFFWRVRQDNGAFVLVEQLKMFASCCYFSHEKMKKNLTFILRPRKNT